jgi:hypothetical protein
VERSAGTGGATWKGNPDDEASGEILDDGRASLNLD